MGTGDAGHPSLAEAERLERRDPAAALRLVADVLAAATDDRTRGEALHRRARILCFDRRLRESADAAHEAEARFAAAGDHDGRARAKIVLGWVFSALGHEEAALEVLDEAIRIAEPVSAETLASARSGRAAALRRAGRLEEAVVEFAEAISAAERPGVPPRTLAGALVNQASAAWQVARVHGARAALDRARALIADHDLGDLAAWHAAIEAWVAIAGGDWARARERAEAALAAGAQGSDADLRLSATRALARALALEDGATEASRARATELLVALAAQCENQGWWADRVFVCRELSDVRERARDLEGALRWLREAQRTAATSERERRAQRLEGERLRLELARLAVEAEQLRIRTESLAQANRELAAMADERAMLLAMVAHDLRTPLTAIRCTLEHQRAQRPGEGLAPETLLSLIDDAAQRMTAMIDDATSTESIRTGRAAIRARRFDLASVAARCVAGLMPLATRKSITLALAGERGLEVVSDEPAAARVIENVLSNALKFTPPGRSVRVELRREPGWAVIAVEDDGPGFAPEELEGGLVAGRAGRAPPTAGEGSTGLGLRVVEDLMRAASGRVELGRAEAGGARVALRWPTG